MRKKEPQIKVFEIAMVDVDLEVFVRMAPFLPLVSILSLRCVNKKLHTVFSRKVVWKALGCPSDEVKGDLVMPWDSGFLMFLNLWDYKTEKKKVHNTPWQKGPDRCDPGCFAMDQLHGRHAPRSPKSRVHAVSEMGQEKARFWCRGQAV